MDLSSSKYFYLLVMEVELKPYGGLPLHKGKEGRMLAGGCRCLREGGEMLVRPPFLSLY